MRKIKRSQICGAAIVMAAALLTGCTRARDKATGVLATETIMIDDQTAVSSEVHDTGKNGDGQNLSSEAETFLKNVKRIHVEKIVMTRTEKEDGSFDTVYDIYYMSDIDLSEKAENSSSFVTGEDGLLIPDSEDVPEAETVFETQILEYSNAKEALCAVINACGYSEHFEEAKLDTDYFSESGSLSFRYEKPQKAVDDLLYGMDGYDLIDASSSYMVEQVAEDINIPTAFLSFARFKKEGKAVIRNSFLKIEPLMNETGSGCDCGHSDMSECDETCAEICNEKNNES